jgi:restriction system protein
MPDELFSPPNPPIGFIGRESELEWLRNQIANREGGYGRPIVITGPGGIGKTALAAKYIEDQRPIRIGVAGSSKTGKSATVNAMIGEDLAPYSGAGPGEYRSGAVWVAARTFSSESREFEEFMRARLDARSDRELVVLDGADEATEEYQHRAVSRILNFKRVRNLIVTSRKDLDLRGERTLRLDSLPTSDAQRLITGFSQLEPESIQKILSLAGGHPLMLNMMATLAQSLSSEDLRNVLSGEAYRLQNEASHFKLVAAAKPLIISANEAIIKNLKKHPKDIFSLTPRQYEELVAELFRDMGYEVELTQATRDGGKDILAAMKTEVGHLLCLIEAKHYRTDRTIGVSLVRALYGTLCDYQATSAMMVTTSSYSKDAQALQKRHEYQLSLRDYVDVAEWIQRYGTNKGNFKN